jgi:hypothetical protein
MKRVLPGLLLLFFALPMFAQGAPPQAGANQPYTMEYYYKVQWGRQQEFLQLFLKNHYPLLKKSVESGRTLRNIVGALGPAGDGHHPIR